MQRPSLPGRSAHVDGASVGVRLGAVVDGASVGAAVDGDSVGGSVGDGRSAPTTRSTSSGELASAELMKLRP